MEKAAAGIAFAAFRYSTALGWTLLKSLLSTG
jgi:hypothetical protein